MFETLLRKKQNNYISKQELYTILEDMPVPIIFSETDGTIRFANKEALKLGGYSRLQGKKCTDTICRGSGCTCHMNGNETLQKSEQKFYLSNGREISVEKKAKPVKFNNELFYAQFITDLTERQENEEELKKIIAEKVVAESKAKNESSKFEELFEGVSEAVFVVDFEGHIIKINQNACQQLEYSREELLSLHIADIIAPELSENTVREFKKIVKREQAVFESVHFTKTGVRIPVEVYINIVEFDGKKAALASARDITIRKRFQEQLLEAKGKAEHNEAELKTIFNKVPSTVIIFDENSRVLRVNEKGRAQFNVGDKDVTNLTTGEAINCYNLKTGNNLCGLNEKCLNCKLDNLIAETITTGKEINKKEISVAVSESGNAVTKTMLFSSAILKSNGTSTYIVALDDITERKKMEVELINSKEKAELSEKLKTAFLNNISHEIRTPLNGIIGFLDFFEEDIKRFSEQERKNFVRIMRKSGDRLINTVTDIVEASKLDSGIMDFNSKPFKLKNSIDAFVHEMRSEYGDHSAEFVCRLDKTLENCILETDESKLHRILRSLLGNAFKFTTEGNVSLTVEQVNKDILFKVADTGIGIPEQDIEVIFNPFRQVDIDLSQAFDGNGLGLTIASKLVKCLGGELEVNSKKGEGSAFYFSLPNILNKNEVNTGNTMHTAKEDPLSLNFQGKKILIAEDDDVNYLFLEAVLSSKGCQLFHASTGVGAVEMFRSHPEIDLIIMDLKMPGMNGIEATLKIREVNKTVPVIAHSAYVMNHEKEKSKAAGCVDYLPKPVKSRDLLEITGKYLYKNNNSN